MNCDVAKPLLHGLIDNEIEPGPVEAHLDHCPRCAAQLADYRAMREAMLGARLRVSAPPWLRASVTRRLSPPRRAIATVPTYRRLFSRFAFAPVLSAAAAALFMFAVLGPREDEALVSDVVSAHMRSLEANRLTDIKTDDRGAVKPWLSGRLGAAPPIPDLKAQGFTLVGGRIDYVLGKPVAAIAYRRDDHIINLFVAQGAGAERDPRVKSVQGLNVELWSERGLNLCVVGDVSADELQAVHDAFDASAAANI